MKKLEVSMKEIPNFERITVVATNLTGISRSFFKVYRTF